MICPNFNTDAVKRLTTYYSEEAVGEIFMKLQTPEFVRWFGNFSDSDPAMQTQEQAEKYVKDNQITIIDIDDDYNIYNLLGDKVPLDNFVTLSDNKGVKSSLIDLKNKMNLDNLKNKLIERSKDVETINQSYFYKGEKILNRVSFFVSKYLNSVFRIPKNKEESNEAKFYGLKGTILHYYNHLIVNDIVNYNDISLDELREKVYQDLRNNPEFEKYKDDKKFFFIKNSHLENLRGYFNNLITTIKNEDPGAQFLTEVTIFNDDKTLGGTIDFLVLNSDGKVGIYDWKSMLVSATTEDENGKYDLKSYKKESFSIQFNLYRDILISSYNVALEDIVKQRAIPIIVSFPFSKGKINQKGGYDLLSIGEVSPQPSFNEITKFDTLNKILNTLYLKRKQINAQLKQKYNDPKLKNELNVIEKMMKDIQLSYDISGIYSSMVLLNTRFLNARDQYENRTEGITSDLLAEFVDINTDLQFFNGLLDNLSDYNESRKEDPDFNYKDNFEEIQIITEQITRQQSFIGDLFKTYLKNSLDEKKSSIDLDNITETGLLEIAQQKSDLKNPVMQAFFTLFVKEAENDKFTKLRAFRESILDYKARINKYAKKNNISVRETMNLFLNENKDLIGVFDKQYIEELKKQKRLLGKTKGPERKLAIDWIKKNAEFDVEEYEIFKKKSFKVIENVNDDAESIAFAKQDFEKMYDVRLYPSAYKSRNTFIKGKRFQENINERFKKIFNDEDLFFIYKGLEEFNKYARKVTGRKINNNFAPNVTNDLAADIVNNKGSVLNIGSNLLTTLKNSFTTTVDEDTFLGTIDPDGTRKNSIPVFFINLFLPELTDKQIEVLENKIDTTEFTKDSTEYKDELTRLVYAERNRLAVENKSVDFLTNFLVFAESVFNYDALNTRLDTLYALKNFAENKALYSPTSVTGTPVVDNAMGKFFKLSGIPKTDAELLETVILEYVAGQKIQTKDMASKLKSGRSLSTNKTILALMNYFSINAIGFKPILGIINTIGVRTNFNTIGREGVYMSLKSNKQSLDAVIKDKNKFFGFAEFMGTDPKGTIHKARIAVKNSNFSKIVNTDSAYAFLSKPEELLANQGLVSMSYFYRVVNGKIVNPNSLFRTGDTKESWEKRVETFPTVYDSVEKEEVTLADGTKRVNIKTKLSNEELNNFRIAVQKVTTSYTGNVSEHDKAAGNANIWYRVFMQMKNWIPPLLKQRTGESRIDIATGQFDVGRYAVFLGELSSQNSKKIETLLDLVKEIFFINNANKSIVNKKVAEYYYKKWLNREFPNDIEKGKRTVSFEQFVKIRNDKFKAAAYEIRVVLAMLLTLAVLGGDWDDDGEENYKEFIGGRTAYKVLTRAYNEITFFTNPLSFKTIVKGAVPVTTFLEKASFLLVNTGDEVRDFITINAFDIDKKGINKRDPYDMTPSLYYTSWFLGGINNLISDLELPEKFSELINTQLTEEERKAVNLRYSKKAK